MKNGDISNQFASAIAIDVDDLIIKVTKPKTIFGRKTMELLPGVTSLLHRLFRADLSIYLTVIRENVKEAKEIEDFLDELYLPYTRLYKLKTLQGLHHLLELPHLTTYYYKDMKHSPPIGSAGKAVRMETLQEGF